MKRYWVQADRIIRESKSPMTRIEKHCHNIFHLVYCMGQSAIMFIDGQYVTLEMNDLVLVAPHVEHAFYVREGFLSIEAKFCCDDQLKEALTRTPYLLSKNDLLASQEMRNILDEVLKQDVYFEEIINEKLLYLIFSLLRKEYGQNVIAPADLRYRQMLNISKDEWLLAVMGYIDDNLGKPISAKDVAEHFGYSCGYFSNIFQKKSSYSLGHYISERKIEAAKELLMAGQSVTEVTGELGFASVHHFSKKFKAMVGVPPTKYNEQVGIQLAVNVSGDESFPPTGVFEYHTLAWDGEHFI